MRLLQQVSISTYYNFLCYTLGEHSVFSVMVEETLLLIDFLNGLGSDFDGEDYGCEDIAIVTNLSCPKCHSIVEVYLPKDTELE